MEGQQVNKDEKKRYNNGERSKKMSGAEEEGQNYIK